MHVLIPNAVEKPLLRKQFHNSNFLAKALNDVILEFISGKMQWEINFASQDRCESTIQQGELESKRKLPHWLSWDMVKLR